ncbi:MAG: hypothetical protein QXJ72_07365 [Thermoproteota archaeon]
MTIANKITQSKNVKQSVLNIIKKNQKTIDKLILIILSALLYRSLILPGIHIAGDWPYFSKDFMYDYLSWPSAWLHCGYPTVFEGIYSLYRFPIRFVQALLIKLFPDHNIDLLITYFIPLILLPPLGMYHLAYKMFNNRYIAFFSGLIFTFNNVLPWRIALGQPTFGMVMALMPIALCSFIDSLHHNSFKASLLTGIVLSISILYDLRITILTILLLGTYGIYYVLINVKEKKIQFGIMRFFKTIVIITFIIIITQAYQILPLTLTGLNPTPLPINYITPRSLQMLSKLTDFFQILILSHFGWGLEEGVVIPQTIMTLIAISSLLVNRDSRVIYLVIIWIIFAFLAKGSVDPMGFLNDWMFINVPFFNWFREPLVFQMVQTVPFALLFGVTISKVYSILDRIEKPQILIFKIVLSMLFITIIIWSVEPAFLMTGAYGDPKRSYLASNYIPTDYYQILQWLKSQEPGRILMLPQYSLMMYTSSTYQGVILRDSSLPLWGDYLAKLLEDNKTHGIAKFLSLYNVKYVVLNPPEDIYWIHYSKPYSYFYSVLNSTPGLKLINIGTKGGKVFINEFTQPPVRTVTKIGLLVGNKADMMKVIEFSNLQEWVFQFANDPSSILNLEDYSAIIFGENGGITDLLVHMVDECYKIPLWEYASLWNIKETSKWVLGYPITPNLLKEVIISPKGLLANPSPNQMARMSFEFSVPESTMYEIWLRLGTGFSSGSITIVIGGKEAGSITVPSDTGLKWMKAGSIQLEKGSVQIQLLGNGQVFLDMMVIVPKYVFKELETSISKIINSKSYTLDEFINTIALNDSLEEHYSIQWVRKRPTSLYFRFANASSGYLIFSELYSPLWLLKSKSYESRSTIAYGLINMFVINSSDLEGEIEYIPQRFVDLGVYISIFGSVLSITLLVLSLRLHRSNFSRMK